ncbi:MAG: TIR domain-containing protein [Hyphomicrobiales bacterium]|nr:TIR domain-containing protein [Hyphomicrobiales bacterium]
MLLVDRKPSRLKVHVSCCDADIGFANKLVAGLTRYGRFNVSVTPKQQAERTGWKDRIGELIAQADTVLFVLSTEAVASQAFVCEAELAAEFSKRMLSLVASPMRIADVPEPLAGLKHRRFDQETLFKNKLELLATLLDADADWVRLHTELFAKARRWKNAGYAEQHLLTKAEISEAKNWTFGRPYTAPKPTMLHVQFIQASEVVRATGGNLSTRSSLDRKRARRKSSPAEPARATVSRSSRSVPVSLSKLQKSWTPAQLEPVAVPLVWMPTDTVKPAAIETAIAPGLHGPAPAISEPTSAASIETSPAVLASAPETEKPIVRKEPARLETAAPKAASSDDIVLNQDELDSLLASLVPDEEDDLSGADVDVVDDAEINSIDDAPAEPATVAAEDAPEETGELSAPEPLPSDDDAVSWVPDPIDALRARNIPGIQKDLDELDPDDLYQIDGAGPRQGQNQLIAAMASSLVIVAGVAMWQIKDYSHVRTGANGQFMVQLSKASSSPDGDAAPHRTNFIERAMDKVECLLQTSTSKNGKCLRNGRPAN